MRKSSFNLELFFSFIQKSIPKYLDDYGIFEKLRIVFATI